MSRVGWIAGLLALGLATGVAAQSLPPAEPPGPHMQVLPTPDFVVAAAQSDEFEVEEGRLAASRAQTARVRQAAAMMVHDHGESTRLMAAAVRRAGLPPAGPPGLDIGQQQMFERLKATTGAAFDRLYVDQQVRAHRQTLDVVTGYVRDGEPGPVRQAAMRVRPVVSRHLAMFERLQSAMR